MSQYFANETQIDKFRLNFVYKLIVHNLLTNYLNLLKETIQKQLLTAVL